MKNLSRVSLGGLYTLIVVMITCLVNTTDYTNIVWEGNRDLAVSAQFSGQTILGEQEITRATVAATKMNVFYLGIDNPVTIVASGADNRHEDIDVSMEGGVITQRNGSKYNVAVAEPGNTLITVKNENTGEELRYPFRVKRIPDPVAKLGGTKLGGSVKSGEFRAQRGVLAVLENFDFDVQCAIESYTIYKSIKGVDDLLEAKNEGDRFNDEAAQLIRVAKPGDVYTFVDIMAKCPGDEMARHINGMAFRVK